MRPPNRNEFDTPAVDRAFLPQQFLVYAYKVLMTFNWHFLVLAKTSGQDCLLVISIVADYLKFLHVVYLVPVEALRFRIRTDHWSEVVPLVNRRHSCLSRTRSPAERGRC